jgi:hypothetical protein
MIVQFYGCAIIITRPLSSADKRYNNNTEANKFTADEKQIISLISANKLRNIFNP